MFSHSIKSRNHYAPKIFDSPWAKNKADEDFFEHVMQTIGSIVKDDVKLGTMYATLLLAIPNEVLFPDVKVVCSDLLLSNERLTKLLLLQKNEHLLIIQNEVSLLIFRYLKNKYKDPILAENTLNTMLR